MVSERTFAGSTVALGVATLAHAIATWPQCATLALFGGGAMVAFVSEAIVVHLDWLEHHIGPRLAGVPPYLLFGWVGTIYVAYRFSLVLTDGWVAVTLAAVIATTYDVLTDHRGVEDGYWAYTDDVPGPRYRGVPWWNFVGWFVISFLTTALTLPFH